MLLTYKVFTPVSMIVFGLFALSSSGVMVGVLWLVLGALVMPAIALTLAANWRRRAAASVTGGVRALAASDARDLSRMDSDKG